MQVYNQPVIHAQVRIFCAVDPVPTLDMILTQSVIFGAPIMGLLFFAVFAER